MSTTNNNQATTASTSAAQAQQVPLERDTTDTPPTIYSRFRDVAHMWWVWWSAPYFFVVDGKKMNFHDIRKFLRDNKELPSGVDPKVYKKWLNKDKAEALKEKPADPTRYVKTQAIPSASPKPVNLGGLSSANTSSAPVAGGSQAIAGPSTSASSQGASSSSSATQGFRIPGVAYQLGDLLRRNAVEVSSSQLPRETPQSGASAAPSIGSSSGNGTSSTSVAVVAPAVATQAPPKHPAVVRVQQTHGVLPVPGPVGGVSGQSSVGSAPSSLPGPGSVPSAPSTITLAPGSVSVGMSAQAQPTPQASGSDSQVSAAQPAPTNVQASQPVQLVQPSEYMPMDCTTDGPQSDLGGMPESLVQVVLPLVGSDPNLQPPVVAPRQALMERYSADGYLLKIREWLSEHTGRFDQGFAQTAPVQARWARQLGIMVHHHFWSHEHVVLHFPEYNEYLELVPEDPMMERAPRDDDGDVIMG